MGRLRPRLGRGASGPPELVEEQTAGGLTPRMSPPCAADTLPFELHLLGVLWALGGVTVGGILSVTEGARFPLLPPAAPFRQSMSFRAGHPHMKYMTLSGPQSPSL